MRDLNPVTHEAFDALRLLGLRDRLRCPECRAVGTWKPHGGWWDRRHGDTRGVRRWLCKWCGHYLGPEGTVKAFPDRARGHWALPGQSDDVPGPTPAVVMHTNLGSTWPWAG
jgi:hypothetical protein